MKYKEGDKVVPSEGWGSNSINIEHREFEILEIWEDPSTELLIGDDDIQLVVYANEVDVVKTSGEWEKEDDSGVIVLDPDGWDRTNYEYSYYEELVTKEEYDMRKMYSTCKFPRDYFKK